MSLSKEKDADLLGVGSRLSQDPCLAFPQLAKETEAKAPGILLEV